MRKSLKMSFALMLAITVIAVGFAAIQYVHYVDNTATIIAVYGIKLVQDVAPYDVEVAAIPWGNLAPAQTKSSIEVFTVKFRLKNADNMDVWVTWNVHPDTPLPAGVTVTAYQYYGTAASEWPQNNWTQDPPSIPTGTVYDLPIEFRITVAPGTPAQSFGFTLNINAHDTYGG